MSPRPSPDKPRAPRVAEGPNGRLLRWLAIGFAVWLAAWPVTAQTPGGASGGAPGDVSEDQMVSWTVRHAAGGVHRAGGLAPFIVELRSQATEALDLTIVRDDGYSRHDRLVRLPAGGTQRVPFYTHAGFYSNELSFELERGKKTVATADAVSKQIDISHTVVGIVGSHPLGFEQIEREDFMRVHLEPRDLPAQVQGLFGLDVIAWVDPSLRDLSPGQIDAVGHWVERGGTLILLLGERWLESSVGEHAAWTRIQALDVAPTGLLPSLARYGEAPSMPQTGPMAVVRTRGGDGVPASLAGSDQLARWEQRGMGRVVVLGLDPSNTGLAGWPGWGSLWSTLLVECGHRPWPGDGYWPLNPNGLQHRTVQAISVDEAVQVPSGGLLAFLLLAYLLAVGPIDYLFLRRRKKLAWTWLTFPLVVVIASYGIYFYVAEGRSIAEYRPRQVLYQDLLPESDRWIEELHVGVFTSSSGDQWIALDDNYPISWVPGAGTPMASMLSGSRYSQYPATASAKMGRWNWLLASAAGDSPAGGVSVDAQLTIREGVLRGTIQSHLGVELQHAMLLAVDQGKAVGYRLPRLADGMIQKVAIDPIKLDGSEPIGKNTPPFDADIPASQARENLSLLRSLILETSHLQVGPSAERDISFVDSPHHDWSRYLRRGGLVLCGWAADRTSRLETLEVQGTTPEPDGVRLIRVPLRRGSRTGDVMPIAARESSRSENS